MRHYILRNKIQFYWCYMVGGLEENLSYLENHDAIFSVTFPGRISSYVDTKYKQLQKEGIDKSKYDIMKEIIAKYRKDGSLPDWKFY